MAHYHFNAGYTSRGNEQSVTERVSYITGKTLRDNYYNETFYKDREDVLYCKIILPNKSPPSFYDLQSLCFEIDKAEKERKKARTARVIVGALPNELPLKELINIVEEFVDVNFTKYGVGAIVAIHEGKNEEHPSKNNPHVHIIVTTRSIGTEGFFKKKNRELDKPKYLLIWRIQWEILQNRAYKRNGIEAEVSCKSLKEQGCKRKPLPHLSFADYQKEKRGIRTIAGDKRREVKKYNKKIKHEKKHSKTHNIDMEM